MGTRRNTIGIMGAGPLGMALALALQERGHAASLFDAREKNAPSHDARVLALSHGSRQLLEALDAWPAAHATPIHTIHVSQKGEFGRSRILREELGLPALGYVLPATHLINALTRRAQVTSLDIRHDATVRIGDADTQRINISVRCSNGSEEAHAMSLVACCEGAVSDETDAIIHDYGQHALLCRARIAGAHGNVAYERFTAQGPIALLPLGLDYAVVWTVSADRVETLKAADDAIWLEHLQAAFGHRVKFLGISERAHYPLGLKMRRKTVGDRVVWLGNAAQTLHPVAGQGFNLALRDAVELADTLAGADDPGAAPLLAAHATRRRADRFGAAAFTDLLVRGFSTDLPLLPGLRGLALTALDMLPPVRHFVAKRMIYGARAWP